MTLIQKTDIDKLLVELYNGKKVPQLEEGSTSQDQL